MRVLVLTQHFTPEITAARARLHSFAAGLAGLGHEVEVIAEVPNHPEGVIQPGYRRRAVVRKEIDGFTVRYVWVRARPSKTTFNRLAFYGSYAAMATAAGSLAKRPDVILASSPPLPTGAAAALVAARHRVPWVLDVRDLWPEVAIALGELRGRRAIGLARRLERRLYGSADAIVTVNDAFRADIAARIERPGPEKLSVIPNGTTRDWLDAGGVEVDRAEVDLPNDQFVWTYAGNVGLAQGLDAAVEAAGILGAGFRLVILGNGPLLGKLRERAAALPPGLVELRDPVQPEDARRLMCASDALLVSLDARPGLEKFVPSKLFDCCAVGRPVVLAANGEAPRLAGDAVLTVPPGDPTALAAAVRSLRKDRGLGVTLAERGRRFASGYLRERQVEQLVVVLEGVRPVAR
jgi:glycosyltransferase involved in cell wall biosynthesis